MKTPTPHITIAKPINHIATRVDGDAPATATARIPVMTVNHRAPQSTSDRFASTATLVLRGLADVCFRQHYIHRSVVLETVAAVPGMVGACIQHLRSLRIMRGRPDMVKMLLDEAENERMHLMTFVALCKPNGLERALILISQGLFFNAFFLLYLISPACAHRMIGYFEEEAVLSYTRFL
jgi:ubiquinol oxidase